MGGLFGSTVLDVVIGLFFVYLLLSILCTSANEWIAGITKSRSTLLERSIKQLLSAQPITKAGSFEPGSFVEQFYHHPLIKGMSKGKEGKNHPAYLSGRVFAKVVMDLVTRKGEKAKATSNPPTDEATSTAAKEDQAFSDFQEAVKNMPDKYVREALLAVIDNADHSLGSAQKAIEGWFEDAMDRASGWYKRRTQIWTVLVAASIIAASNADTIRITRRLMTNPEVRAAIVEGAKSRAQEPQPSVSVEYPDPENPDNPTVTELEGQQSISQEDKALLGQVFGWQPDSLDPVNLWGKWLQRILGWLLTLLAVSLGAPFWFDLLNKFVHIRSAGKSPDEVAKRPEKKKLPPADKTA